MHALPHYIIRCLVCMKIIAQCACDVDDAEREMVVSDEPCDECKEKRWSTTILAHEGQPIFKIFEDGITKTYLVLTLEQLFAIRTSEPHRLRKIDGEWCVRVEHIN